MAGQKNLGLRKKVRSKLLTKKGQELSDRAIAGEFDCARSVVKSVRLQLIAAGLHPKVTENANRTDLDPYKPGSVARGGYVYDENGNTVRETVWKARQRAKRSSER